jgi:hypothetical protein
LADQPLHRVIRHFAVDVAKVENLNHVGIAELGDRLSFALKAQPFFIESSSLT